MKLNQIFYSIAACCLLMATFVVLKVSAYSGNNGSCYKVDGACVTHKVGYEAMVGDGGSRSRTYLRANDVERYKTTNIYDFRGRHVAIVNNIQDVRNDSMPVILFNTSTVFPEDFNPYSDMFCNQLSNDETLCFYPKL